MTNEEIGELEDKIINMASAIKLQNEIEYQDELIDKYCMKIVNYIRDLRK